MVAEISTLDGILLSIAARRFAVAHRDFKTGVQQFLAPLQRTAAKIADALTARAGPSLRRVGQARPLDC